MTDTDLRALGRLGQSQGRPRDRRRRRRLATRAVRGVPAATARRRLPRPLLVLVAVLAAGLAYLGITAVEQTGPSEEVSRVAPASDDDAVAAPSRDVTDRASRGGTVHVEPAVGPVPAFAEADGLRLSLPHHSPEAVAFHEASLADALPLTPIGRLVESSNPTFEGGIDQDDPAYHVLPSRGRPQAATSAIDVVVPRGTTVVSPVSGTVVETRRYALVGSTRDWRVVIKPDERPDLHVVLTQLHRPAVTVDEAVAAGRTPVAVARQLPYERQVDALVDGPLPAVRIEVKPATAPQPPDPNEPAVDPDEALGIVSR